MFISIKSLPEGALVKVTCGMCTRCNKPFPDGRAIVKTVEKQKIRVLKETNTNQYCSYATIVEVLNDLPIYELLAEIYENIS